MMKTYQKESGWGKTWITLVNAHSTPASDDEANALIAHLREFYDHMKIRRAYREGNVMRRQRTIAWETLHESANPPPA